MFGVAVATAVAVAQYSPVAVTSDSPRIIVQGESSVMTVPNLARLSYNVRGEGRTSDEAVSNLVAKTAAIENALRSMDPSVDLHSESVRVETVRGTDCKENDYNERAVVSTGVCAIEGFVATQDFGARTSQVDNAGTMVGFAARRGASDPRIQDFDVADTGAAKRQAIAGALAEARTKAEAIAAASGIRLGEILSVSLDGAEANEIVVTGSRMRSPAAERDEPITISITPEPVETTARVTVSYAIAR